VDDAPLTDDGPSAGDGPGRDLESTDDRPVPRHVLVALTAAFSLAAFAMAGVALLVWSRHAEDPGGGAGGTRQGDTPAVVEPEPPGSVRVVYTVVDEAYGVEMGPDCTAAIGGSPVAGATVELRDGRGAVVGAADFGTGTKGGAFACRFVAVVDAVGPATSYRAVVVGDAVRVTAGSATAVGGPRDLLSGELVDAERLVAEGAVLALSSGTLGA
jgi:hypothetical protein